MKKSATKYEPVQFKALLRLASQRCKTLSQKRSSLNTLARKEVAKLLAAGKEESARVKVEHVIREDNIIEAMEMIDLYCQMLISRFGLLQAHQYLEDESLKDPVYTLVWASQFMPSDVKELQPIKMQLIDKYPKDLAEVIVDLQQYANPKVVKKLNPEMKAPSKRLVDAYLAEIASTHGIAWSPSDEPEATPTPAPAQPLPQTANPIGESSVEAGIDESSLGFHQFLKQRTTDYQAQVRAPTTDNDLDDLGLPAVPNTPPGGDGGGASDVDDDFDDLAARFQNLKK